MHDAKANRQMGSANRLGKQAAAQKLPTGNGRLLRCFQPEKKKIKGT